MPLLPSAIKLWPGETNPNDIRLRDVNAQSDLAMSAGIRVSSALAITAPVAFKLAATVQIGSRFGFRNAPDLALDSTIQVSSNFKLTTIPTLSMAPQVQVSLSAQLVQANNLAANMTMSVGMQASLTTVPNLSANPTVSVVSAFTLRRAAQQLAVSTGVQFGTRLDLTRPSRGISVISIGGTAQTHARYDKVNVTDVLNEAPNTCDLVIDTTPRPSEGSEILIGIPNLLNANLLFAGTLTRVSQYFEGKFPNIAWQVSAVDYTYLFNRRKVFGKFKDISASTVASTLITKFTSGFSIGGIQAGLPNVTMDWNGVEPASAFTDLAKAIGGYFFVGYDKVVNLKTSQDPIVPDDITDSSQEVLNSPAFNYVIDLTQIRTQVQVRGKSSRIVGLSNAEIPSISTSIPLDDTKQFSSGQVITDNYDLINYTGAGQGGNATRVTGTGSIGPAGSVTLSISTTKSGHLIGIYRYIYTFSSKGTSGETPGSSVSQPITAIEFGPPTSPVGVAPTGILGPLNGTYKWITTFVNSLGETVASPPATRTAIGLTVTGAGQQIQAGPAGISRLQPGTYQWRVTYFTQFGETPGGPVMTTTLTPVNPPTVTSVQNFNTPGLLQAGSPYTYATTFVTQDGETNPGGLSTFTVPALALTSALFNGTVAFGGLQVGPYSYGASYVTSIGETAISTGVLNQPLNTSSPGQLVFTGQQDINAGRIAPGFTYLYACTFYHTKYGETPLGPVLTFPVGGSVPIRVLFNLPVNNVPPSSLAEGIRVYRAIQAVGNINSTPFQLNFDFRAPPGQTGGFPLQYIDALSQGECGGNFPIIPMAAGVNEPLTILPANDPGVLARRIYRTRAGGTEFFLVGQVDGNAQVNFTDKSFDQDNTVRAPLVNSTGRQTQIGIQTGPSGTTARRIYRSKAGTTSPLFLIAEIPDNTTTSYIDNTADTALTKIAPSVNDAGSFLNGTFKPAILLPAHPAGAQGRRIYRTKLGGGVPQLAGEVRDSTQTVFVDDLPDINLDSQKIPLDSVNTAGGEEENITSIPIGPTGTLARIVYRTLPGGADFFQVARIADNVTRQIVDRLPDTSLTNGVPLVNTAGGQAVLLSNIQNPVGLNRVIYRTKNTGSATGPFYYVDTVEDPTATTYIDTKSDDDLGHELSTSGQLGALAGQSTLSVTSTAGFFTPGWIKVGNQYIEYQGSTPTTFTGIRPVFNGTIVVSGDNAVCTTTQNNIFPNSATIVVSGCDQPEFNGVQKITGLFNQQQFQYKLPPGHANLATGSILFALPGSIQETISVDTLVEGLPILNGISPALSTLQPLEVGSGLAIWVVRTSSAGVAAIAAKEGGDGIHQFLVNDAKIESVAAAQARGDAELATFQFGVITMEYPTRDIKSRSGRTVHVALGAPHNITTDLLIQRVVISQIGTLIDTMPLFQVTATNSKFSIEDLIRHLLLDIH